MEFLDPKIEQYVSDHTEKESDILYQLYRETWQKVINPRMLAGNIQGRIISMLSHMIQPKSILEVGTYTGYSAICWAEGLAENGKVHSIDINEELEPLVTRFFEKAGVNHLVKRYYGNAMDLIPTMKQEWDIVFLDADKSNYLNYYNMVIDQVRPGGYIIADNVLWSGKVIEDPTTFDEDTKALDAYNKYTQEDERVQTVLFPVRDGIMISRKL